MSHAEALAPHPLPAAPADLELRFFVVGAQKAGTTTLHDWLASQSCTALPALKETHFLSDAARRGRGLDWYAAQFRGRRDALHGEVDPEYLYHPSAPEWIHELWPAARIVIVLRNPVARAFSQYQMSRARGLEQLGFEDALEAEDGRLADGDPASTAVLHQSYLLRSGYVAHIERFHRWFPPEQVRLVRFEDLFGEQRAETLTDLAQFIGLESAPELGSPALRSNARWNPRSRRLMEFLYGESRVRRLLGRLLPSQDLRLRVGVWLERLNRRPAPEREPVPPLSPRWSEAFDCETRAVEHLTGWDLRSWYLGVPV